MDRMNNQINIQDQFLNRIRQDWKRVIVELAIARKIEGVILGFLNFCIVQALNPFRWQGLRIGFDRG